MRWEDILDFDENDAEHVQALKARCLRGGQKVYSLYKKRGLSPSKVSEFAESFGVNMSIDDRFPPELLHLEVLGGSEYWWKWVQQMSIWWLEGYCQTQANDSTSF